MAARVLIVDDDSAVRYMLHERLREEGLRAWEAGDVQTAQRLLKSQPFELAIIDVKLPDGHGIDLMKRAIQLQPGLAVLIITGYSSVNGAVDAMKQGAFDYLTKPLSLDEFADTARRALASRSRTHVPPVEAGEKKHRFGITSIVGRSRRFNEVKTILLKVAASESTSVLLLGETGTGKDMFARAVHYESARVEHPFMNVTCTAMPETLIESELFGYEEGAFTNAAGRKAGLFELAHRGTIFLDEIGDMPSNLQGKLLRVLEEQAFRRIGGTQDITVDCRVIAATNKDLGKLIEEGKFREDLYYRLSTVPVVLPPLRERLEDVPLLAQHFLEQYRRKLGRGVTAFTPAAFEKMQDYAWPGNVRELRNVVERAVLLSSGEEIDADDFTLGRRESMQKAAGHPLVLLPQDGCDLAEVERSLLEQALARTEGNQTRAAVLLGITRDQVRYKMEKHRLSV